MSLEAWGDEGLSDTPAGFVTDADAEQMVKDAVAELREALRFLLHSCGGFDGGKPPYYAPSQIAVASARAALVST